MLTFEYFTSETAVDDESWGQVVSYHVRSHFIVLACGRTSPFGHNRNALRVYNAPQCADNVLQCSTMFCNVEVFSDLTRSFLAPSSETLVLGECAETRE